MKKIFIFNLALLILIVAFHIAMVFKWYYYTFNDISFPYDNASIGLFYKRTLDRVYLDLFHFIDNTRTIDEEIDEVSIYIDKEKVAELDSDLPQSGREYKKAKMVFGDEEYNIKLRYRGDNYYHWLFEKKSLKIKLKKDEKIWNHRVLQLTNIKGSSYFNEYLGNKLAEKMGLMTVQEKFTRVYINDMYQGVYLYLEPLDKEFIELNNKALGELWFGDLASPEDQTIGLPVDLFKSPYIWSLKEGSSVDYSNLIELLSSIKDVVVDNKIPSFNQIMEEKSLVKFMAWINIAQSDHIDWNHNIVLFFDNTNGKFTQIPWDNGAFNAYRNYLNISTNDLMLAFYKNPVLVYKKNKVIMDTIRLRKLDTLVSDARKMKNAMEKSLVLDPYKSSQNLLKMPIMSYDGYLKNFNKTLSFVDKADKLKDLIGTSKVSFAVDNNKLSIFVDGYSAVKINQIDFANPWCATSIKNIQRIYDKKVVGSVNLYDEILYPGLKIGEEFMAKRYNLVNAPLRYDYMINGRYCEIKKVKIVNLFNQSIVEATSLKKPFEMDLSSLSIHPWKIELQQNNANKTKIENIKQNHPAFIVNNKTITIPSGLHMINDDLIFPKGYQIFIQPGAKLYLSKQASIVSYGKITALGTSAKPITVKAQDSSKPFGVFALVNEDAGGSKFEYFHISGGSETRIDGLYLSGMFSVYHADDVIVKNSIFKNAQADDALNFKYSNSSVYDSLFENNSADAIDFDYMSGEISGNTFINNGNDSVDTSGSTTVVKNNYMKDSGDKCISLGEKSYLTITNNVLNGCNIGVEAKDESEPIISNNVFMNNKTALNAYQKKDFFGPAHPQIFNSIFINNDKNITTENTFEGKKLDSDDSQIKVFSSLFDQIEDEDVLKDNLEENNLSKFSSDNNYSINNTFFPYLYNNRPQDLVDKSIGLSYPNLIPPAP